MLIDVATHDKTKDQMYNRATFCLDKALNERDFKTAAIWFDRAQEECNRAAEWLRRLAREGTSTDE